MPQAGVNSKRRWLRPIVGGVAALVALAVLFIVGYALVLRPELPNHREVMNPQVELATLVLDAEGQELARFYRENRTWVDLDAISPHVVDALIAVEDHRFYEHWGIDARRLLSSLFKTVKGDRQGGSTLTMQLARNLYPEVGQAPAVERKLKELMMAFRIERTYDKPQILKMYLNTVPFGYNAFGIEAAAQTYFSKTAADLDVAESALLVGILKGTSRYNPRRHPERARHRRNVVLGQMARHSRLDQNEYLRLLEAPLDLHFSRPTLADGPAPHFVEYVRGWLEDWAAREGLDPYADGLRVHTSLDPALQALAREAVAEEMEGLQAVVDVEWSRASGYYLGESTAPYRRTQGRVRPFAYFWNTHSRLVDDHVKRTDRYRRSVTQGAASDPALARLKGDAAFMDSLRTAVTRLEAGFVALDPATGYVKAWVGGRDFLADQYDHVGLARRQPGSTFKPFVYTAAIDFGYSPHYTFYDSIRTFEASGGGRAWRPTNSGGASGRKVTLRDGLVYSKNTVTAQLAHAIGLWQVATFAERMGIKSELRRVPSLALGTSEVTLLELAGAYGTLAANGVAHAPRMVTRVEDRHGRVLARFDPEGRKAVSAYTTYLVLDMMRDVVNQGTATRLRSTWGLDADLAGKTGTTQNSADGWFLALHPRLVVGAWVGFNDRRITFRSNFWGQGGHNALHLVGHFLKDALANDLLDRTATFQPPPGFVEPQPPLEDERDEDYYADYDAWLSSDPYMREAYATRYESDLPSEEDEAAAEEEEPDADIERTLRARALQPAALDTTPPPLPLDTLALKPPAPVGGQ